MLIIKFRDRHSSEGSAMLYTLQRLLFSCSIECFTGVPRSAESSGRYKEMLVDFVYLAQAAVLCTIEML